MNASTRQTPPLDAIVVTSAATEDDEPSAIVQSNAAFVEMLFDEYIEDAEIFADAMRSYHVDQFLAEWENGHFSQFVYNTRWDPAVVAYVREGLKAMGSKRYLKAFEKGAKAVDALGKAKLEEYLDGDYFDQEEEPIDWEPIDEAIEKAGDSEDIADLHAAWLRKHPRLFVVATEEEMQKEARRRGAMVPNREERMLRRLAMERRHIELIDSLCAESGQKLEKVTGAESQHEFEGSFVTAYHFITNEGHHHFIEQDGRALMFRGVETEGDEVCSIDAPPERVLH